MLSFQMQSNYYGVGRAYVQLFCKECPTCQSGQSQRQSLPNAPTAPKPPMIPIEASSFMQRVQLDLIDMCDSPDGNYHYIAHFMDHFSKYHILFPLVTKKADEVSKMFTERVLAFFGPPHIIHSDNGEEFVNDLIRGLLKLWNHDVTFINGRPSHSQSLKKAENGNAEVEKKIACMKNELCFMESSSVPWASWLPGIMYTLNSQQHHTTNDSPYHAVFRSMPSTAMFPAAKRHIMTEEEMGEIGSSIVKTTPASKEEPQEFQEYVTPSKTVSTPRSKRKSARKPMPSAKSLAAADDDWVIDSPHAQIEVLLSTDGENLGIQSNVTTERADSSMGDNKPELAAFDPTKRLIMSEEAEGEIASGIVKRTPAIKEEPQEYKKFVAPSKTVPAPKSKRKTSARKPLASAKSVPAADDDWVIESPHAQIEVLLSTDGENLGIQSNVVTERADSSMGDNQPELAAFDPTEARAVRTTKAKSRERADTDDEDENMSDKRKRCKVETDVVCTCGGLHEESLMVICDCCNAWYHADCIDNTGKSFEDEFTCSSCLQG